MSKDSAGIMESFLTTHPPPRRSLRKFLADTFLERTSLITTAVKVIRLFTAVVLLSLTTSLFREWYASNDEHIGQKPPSLKKFVLIFYMLDVALNLIITLIMFLTVESSTAKASLFDYLISTGIAAKFSWTVAGIFDDPKKFDYVADADILIGALEKLTLTFVVFNAFLPYYLFVRHIIY
jgi:hypothetical protein